jgi:hypothetical protein
MAPRNFSRIGFSTKVPICYLNAVDKSYAGKAVLIKATEIFKSFTK